MMTLRGSQHRNKKRSKKRSKRRAVAAGVGTRNQTVGYTATKILQIPGTERLQITGTERQRNRVRRV